MSAHTLGALLALAAALGFSMKAIFVKLAYAYAVGAVTLLSLRMLFALPAFVWVGLRASRGAPGLQRRDYLSVLALGLLGYYGASIFDFLGLQYISAGLERLILFTYPTLTLLIGVLFQGKTLTGRQLASLLLCYLGIAAAFAHDLEFAVDSTMVWIGGGFVFASSLSYALYLSGSAPMIHRLGAARFTALAMLVSTAGTLLHFALAAPLASLWQQPWQVYALGAAMALFSTVLPVFMQSAAIRHLGAGQSALIGTTGPIITIFLGWWWLDEPLSGPQLFGAGLVLAGVLLVSLKPRQAAG
ncbi:MAG: hypothetical protein RIR00_241 [Pseudomonadota bacterium]|jgi:drug/metabolite transporter (DMT)-like permease